MAVASSAELHADRQDALSDTQSQHGREETRGYVARALRWCESPAVAYVLIVLLQLKVIWDDWKLRDLTSGDTSSYFVNAVRWAETGMVDIVWSPLYAVYYGALLLMLDDAASTTWIHRTIITFTTVLLVLATMRQFLPPFAAWLIAAWWTVLESAFNVHYEVHLFAIIPLLLAILVTIKVRGVWGRALAIGVLGIAAVLLRNEYAVAAMLFGGCCFLYEVRQLYLRKTDRWAYAVRHVGIYATPVVAVLLLVGFFYTRAVVKFPELVGHSEPKHTLNICQVYAVGYQQRYTDWKLSPWTECQNLMTRQFGSPLPSLGAALKANPSAMIEHFLWNAELTPSGLQVSLFNAMAGQVTPDYGPVPIARRPVLILTALLLAVIVIGLGVFVTRRGAWARRSIAASPWGWLILVSSVCVTMLVIPVERPRPEYIYPLTLLIMAMVGMSLALVYSCLPERLRTRTRMLAPLTMLGILAVAPSYWAAPEHAKPQRLLTDYLALKPFTPLFAERTTVFMKGDYAGDLVGYLGRLKSRWLSYELLDQYDGGQRLDDFLVDRGVTLFFANQRILDRLQPLAGARPLLTDPESVGWQLIGQQASGPTSWMLFQRTASAPTTPVAVSSVVPPIRTSILNAGPDVAEAQREDALLIGSGWYPVEQGSTSLLRRFGNDAELALTAPSGKKQSIELDLDLKADPRGRTVKLSFSDQSGLLATAAVSPGRRKVIITPTVEAGKSTVFRLRLIDADSNTPVDPQLLDARVFGIRWADG